MTPRTSPPTPPTPLTDDEICAALRAVEIPEPSPLFWDHLSQRVHDAVALEPVPSSSWIDRINFAWAGGIAGALAAALIAVTLSVRHPPVGPVAAPAPLAAVAAVGDGALPSLDDDASWAVMGELASEIDFDEAGAAGLALAPGGAEGALNQMSGDEQRAVVEFLQQEIKNSGSL